LGPKFELGAESLINIFEGTLIVKVRIQFNTIEVQLIETISGQKFELGTGEVELIFHQPSRGRKFSNFDFDR